MNWGTNGDAQVLLGGKAAPAAAAMINGTMAHCLDYDDTHVGSTTHVSGRRCVCAGGGHISVRAKRISSPRSLRASKSRRVWVMVRDSRRTFAVFMRPASLVRLVRRRRRVCCTSSTRHVPKAFGAVATQTGGLSASFGTMSKPFHAGKAALNGVLSAELAGEGFIAKEDLMETDGGLSEAIFQDGGAALAPLDFNDEWEITRNTFKPYAACLLTHALIDAARSLSDQVKGKEIAKIEAVVSEPAVKLAGKPNPQTPLEGKFSLAYCAALGLSGYEATEEDFCDERIADPHLRDILLKV